MAIDPERAQLQPEEGLRVPQEIPEVPESVAKQGVAAIPEQFSANVTNNQGQNVLEPISTTIETPYDESTLTRLAKGATGSSSSWLGAFWLRIIKIAQRLGWRVKVANATNS